MLEMQTVDGAEPTGPHEDIEGDGQSVAVPEMRSDAVQCAGRFLEGLRTHREIQIQSHADPAQSIDLPSPTLRSGGKGHDGCCLRLQGFPLETPEPGITMRSIARSMSQYAGEK